VHAQGVCDLIAAYAKELKGICALKGHPSLVYGLAVLPGGVLTSCSADLSVRVWH
jgi:WD40 repeat protein